MAVAASGTTVKESGTSTAFTNEATTKLTANTVYQITDTTKQIVDPDVAVTVEVDADGGGAGGYAVATASTYTFDYLTGKVTFDADQGAPALVRVSGSYLPLNTIATAREFAVSASRDVLDESVFPNTAHKKKLGLKDLSGSLSLLEHFLTNHGTGSGTLDSLLANGTAKLLEIQPGGSGQKLRAWVLFESQETKGGVDGLTEGSLSFNGTTKTGSGQTEGAAYAWVD